MKTPYPWTDEDYRQAARALAEYFGVMIRIVGDPTSNRKQLWIDGKLVVDKEQ